MPRGKLVGINAIDLDVINFKPSTTEVDNLIVSLNSIYEASYDQNDLSKIIEAYRYMDFLIKQSSRLEDIEHTFDMISRTTEKLRTLISDDCLDLEYDNLNSEFRRRTGSIDIKKLDTHLLDLIRAANFHCSFKNDLVISTPKANKISTMITFKKYLSNFEGIKFTKTRGNAFEKLCRSLINACKFEYKNICVDNTLPQDLLEYLRETIDGPTIY